MLSNAYFLANFRFDTAENGPAKNLLNFANFPNFQVLRSAQHLAGDGPHPGRPGRVAAVPLGFVPGLGVRGLGSAKLANFAKFCKILQFLAGSFSAVSKRNFARRYAFDSIFQALQDLHPFAPLQSQNFRKKSV